MSVGCSQLCRGRITSTRYAGSSLANFLAELFYLGAGKETSGCMLWCLFPFASKRNHHPDLAAWQRECLNIAGPGLCFLLLLLFSFRAENGFLPPAQSRVSSSWSSPFSPGCMFIGFSDSNHSEVCSSCTFGRE